MFGFFQWLSMIDDVAEDVEHAAQCGSTDRHGQRFSGVDHAASARQSTRRDERDSAHGLLIKLAENLQGNRVTGDETSTKSR